MIQTTTANDWNFILSTGSAVTNNAFGVGFNWGGAVGRIGVDSYNAYYSPTTVSKIINDGLWHTVLITYDGTTLSIYVDGILDNTATNWNVGTTNTIASLLNTQSNNANYLGVGSDGNSDSWSGKLKSVIFYDYVVKDSYNVLYTSGNK